MIVHCPSCDAINDVPPARASSGGTVIACSSCGHEWTESRLNDIGPEPKSRETGPDIHQLMLAARQAREAFTTQRRQRQIKAASWLGLLMLAMSPLLVALALPERVVAVAPASIAFYNWLGWDVNIYGLDIRKLAVEHLNVDGHAMITVKGELTNISGSDRKLPWLRFSLRNDDYVEVYTWQLDTRAQLLKPGESRSFATKLASPPESARKVEIRFARADEIGSNTDP